MGVDDHGQNLVYLNLLQVDLSPHVVLPKATSTQLVTQGMAFSCRRCHFLPLPQNGPHVDVVILTFQQLETDQSERLSQWR